MDATMILERSTIAEILVAVFTAERFFSAVDTLVQPQRADLIEAFVTLLTAERFLSAMGALVSLHIVALVEALFSQYLH